jgi:hypothetical protein
VSALEAAWRASPRESLSACLRTHKRPLNLSSRPKQSACENFLYGFKAAHGAARTADSGRHSRAPAGAPARLASGARSAGAKGLRMGPQLEPQEGRGAAADLTREPSRRPSSSLCGQARSQPDPPTSVRATAPCQIRRSVRVELTRLSPLRVNEERRSNEGAMTPWIHG